jgi:hypothetical protein
LVNLALKLTPWAIKWNLPFVKLILRKKILVSRSYFRLVTF